MTLKCAVKDCRRHAAVNSNFCTSHTLLVNSISTTAEVITKGPETAKSIKSLHDLTPSTLYSVKVSEKSGIDKTLEERGQRYGQFQDHAVIAQDIQNAMRKPAGWNRLAPDQKQALTVIADKIARMLNGDPDYIDNWHDIIGYAKLVETRLNEPKNVASGNSEEKK